MAGTGVGSIIDNKYEILASIGRGGMSRVWLGKDRRLDKMWAIKEFLPSKSSSQGAANRQAIIDEANFIKRLDHPAIPRVVDIVDTGASIFVVMDFVDGTALNKVLRQQNEPFEQERVIEWGIELCEVLEYLHGLENPVVYRDMKPANIMLRGDDTVKLIDFGISMELMPSGPTDMRVIGTGGYGAPEQVDKEIHKIVSVDTRADIYALGATLYSLVTNHVPRAKTDETGKKSVDFEMRPIREWNPQLSEGLEQILIRATQADPNDRYQTAAEMRSDLERYKELTQEYRAAQQSKVDGFWRRVAAAGVALGLGVACVVTSVLVRNSNYEALMHEASVATADERNVLTLEKDGAPVRSADASEAEEFYTQAIGVNPRRIETYNELVSLYERDGVFTATEERRWALLWQQNGRALEGDEKFGKLCYDVGVMYLVYYDYMDSRSTGKGVSGSQASVGQGAVENSIQSIRWFEQAQEHPGSLSADELKAANTYVKIGTFYDQVTKANREGEDAKKIYGDYWQTLEELMLGLTDDSGDRQEPLVEGSSEMIRLRVYQVAFESVASSAYLSGFRRAGVTQESVKEMLDAIERGASDLANFVASTRDAAQPMYDEITAGMSDARANVNRTYRNAPVQGSGSGDDSREA